MRHIIFHSIYTNVNPLEIINRVIAPFSFWYDMVKTCILTDDKLLAGVGTKVLLPLEKFLNG